MYTPLSDNGENSRMPEGSGLLVTSIVRKTFQKHYRRKKRVSKSR
jgi:hypothetical protein